MEKHHAIGGVAAALMIAAAGLPCFSGEAFEPPPTDRLAANLDEWGENFRRAGGSPLEITRFQDLIRSQSPAELTEWENFLRASPADFFDRYLTGERRDAGERTPKPQFSGAAPVISCEGHVKACSPSQSRTRRSSRQSSIQPTATPISSAARQEGDRRSPKHSDILVTMTVFWRFIPQSR
jgi:hypothetical protein